MKIFTYIYLLIFLWFPNDVKAMWRISFDSSSAKIRKFIISTFKEEGSRCIPLPFSSKINFRTFYNFDLEFCQNYEIYLAWKKYFSQPSPSGFVRFTYPKFCSIITLQEYICKNENTSFIPTFSFSISKRTKITKNSERVDSYFDFSIPILSFQVILLTKDGERFRFFHAPECENESDEYKRRGKPFRFSLFNFIKENRTAFLVYCGYRRYTIEKHPEVLDGIDEIFSFLYCFASLFSFCFDIMICSYLFCCIKIPIISVFELFFLFRYLFLKKKHEEIVLLNEYNYEENILKAKRDNFLAGLKKFSLFSLLSIFNFSIRF